MEWHEQEIKAQEEYLKEALAQEHGYKSLLKGFDLISKGFAKVAEGLEGLGSGMETRIKGHRDRIEELKKEALAEEN